MDLTTACETDIQNYMRVETQKLIPGILILRNTTGATQNSHGGYIKYGLGTGSHDIIMVLPDGGRVATIEVKTAKEMAYIRKHWAELKNYSGTSKKKTHLKQQIDFMYMILSKGGYSGFACNMEGVRKILKIE